MYKRQEGLTPLVEHPLIGDVRGFGLGIGIDFLRRNSEDIVSNTDGDQRSIQVYQDLMNIGMIVRPAGRSIVIAPPLIVNENEIDDMISRVKLVLESIG